MTHRDVNEAIQDVIGLLRVPRSGLGICCSGRGAVAGRLLLQERPAAPWLDCSTLGIDGAHTLRLMRSGAAHNFHAALCTHVQSMDPSLRAQVRSGRGEHRLLRHHAT